MVSRRWLSTLVVAALLLPIVVSIVAGAARLLGAMGDASGKAALDYVALAAAILWGIDLVVLVIALGFESVVRGAAPDDDVGDGEKP